MTLCVTYSRGMKPFVIDYLRSRKTEITDTEVEGKVFFSGLSCNFLHVPCAERLFQVLSFQKHAKETNKRELFNHLFGHQCLSSSATQDFLSRDSGEKKTFRLSIKTSGKWRRKIDSTKLAESLSRALKKTSSKLSVNLRSPDVELCIQITESFVFVGVPQGSLLSIRNYHHVNGLRSTVCDAMVHLAELQCGQIVADITCGSGSILVEASHSLLPESLFCVGFDCNPDTLLSAKRNFDYCQKVDGLHSLCDLICLHASAKSFRWADVNRIVADLPFGNQHGNDSDIKKVLFPNVIEILAKFFVSSENDKKIAILLLSDEHRVEFIQCLKESAANVTIEDYRLSLGYTDAAILKIVCLK